MTRSSACTEVWARSLSLYRSFSRSRGQQRFPRTGSSATYFGQILKKASQVGERMTEAFPTHLERPSSSNSSRRMTSISSAERIKSLRTDTSSFAGDSSWQFLVRQIIAENSTTAEPWCPLTTLSCVVSQSYGLRRILVSQLPSEPRTRSCH